MVETVLHELSDRLRQSTPNGTSHKEERRQDRRFFSIVPLRQEAEAWSRYCNNKQRGVDWQFKIDDARTKLKSLYPKIQN